MRRCDWWTSSNCFAKFPSRTLAGDSFWSLPEGAPLARGCSNTGNLPYTLLQLDCISSPCSRLLGMTKMVPRWSTRETGDDPTYRLSVHASTSFFGYIARRKLELWCILVAILVLVCINQLGSSATVTLQWCSNCMAWNGSIGLRRRCIHPVIFKNFIVLVTCCQTWTSRPCVSIFHILEVQLPYRPEWDLTRTGKSLNCALKVSLGSEHTAMVVTPPAMQDIL